MTKRKSLKITTILLVLMMVLTCLSGCGEDKTDDKSSAKNKKEDVYHGEEGRITVYLSGPEPMINLLEQSFEHDRGDVVEIFHAGCGPLKQKIFTEVENGEVYADVYFGSNPLIYYDFIEKDALQEYKPKNAKNIKKELQQDQDYFSLVSTRYQIVAFDKTGDLKPKEYNDLLKKEYNELLAYTDPAQSDTALALTCGLYEINDNSMKYFEELSKNNALIVPKSKSIAEKIESGEIAAGITPHDAILRLNRKANKEGYESRLAMAFPEDGAIRIERPVAIMKNDARPEENEKLAEEFVEFLLSEKAQNIMANFGFYSTVEGVAAPKGLPEDVKAEVVDWKKVTEQKDEINEEFATIFGADK